MKRFCKGKGFTLIELLIVVAIIAILAAIAVPNFLEAQVRAKVSRVKNDLRTIDVALTSYTVDNNHYPYPRGGNGVEKSWICYMFEITTPISYLSSVSMADPFQPKNWGGSVWGLYLPYLTYQYCNYGGFVGDVYDIKPRPNAYSLASNGPNRMPDFIEWGTNRNDIGKLPWEFVPFNKWETVYDTTNGTVSKGDIARFAGVQNAPQW